MRFRLKAMAWAMAMGLIGGNASALQNDAFGSATDLGSVASVRVSFDSRPATRQVGEPSHGGDSYTGSVWWRWTAPADGLLWLSLPHSSADSGTRVVYTGESLGSLIEVADDSYGRLEVTVEAGQSYAIVLAEEVLGQLELEFHPVPSNDDFANRQDMGANAVWSVGGSTVAASREEGEPLPKGDSTQGPSIWWKWEVPEDGLVSFDLIGTDEAYWNVGVYSGESIEALEVVHESSRYSNTYASLSRFRVARGESLSIVAATDTTGKAGDIRINWSLEPTRYQGNPESAVDLGMVTEAVGEGITTAVGNVLGGSNPLIWWAWTAPANGSLQWQLGQVGEGSAPTSAVYDAELNRLNIRDSDGGYYCRAGETYFLTASTSQQDQVTYALSFTAADAKDDLAAAAPLVMGDNPYDLSTAGLEANEPQGSSWPWDRSVWWSWTPPSDGVIFLEVDGRYDKPHLGLWLESNLAEPLAFQSFPRQLSMTVEAGAPIKIGVLGDLYNNDALGPDLLRASFIPAVGDHDDFADAIDLGDGLRVLGFGDTENATSEPGETVRPYGDASLWWKWTAPVDCYVRARNGRPGSNMDSFVSRISLRMGSAVDTLVDYTPGSLVPAGEVLWISLGNWSGTSLPVLFELTALPAPANDSFAAATDLGGIDEWDERLVLDGASLETGESHPTSGGSLWWQWTAPRDGNVEFFGPNWHVYHGTAIDALQRLGSSSSTESCRFAAVAGRRYYFALVGASGMPAAVRMKLGPIPGGDWFDDPVVVSSAGDFELTPPQGGTLEAEDLLWFPDVTKTFWWRWEASEDGSLAPEDSVGEGIPWYLFEESGGALVPVNDWAVSAGRSYRIAYASKFEGSARRWLFHAAVANDDFVNALDLGTSTEWTDDQSIWSATVDAGELELLPTWASLATGGTWWKWTAPSDGALTIEARMLGSFGSCALVVGSGSDPASMEVLLSPGTSMGSTRSGTVRVKGGQQLAILVGTRFWRDEGDLQLTLEFAQTPPNDHWTEATDLGSAASAVGSGTNVGALRDEFEETYLGGAVWWSWVASATGNAFVTADLLSDGERLAVFRAESGSDPVAAAVTPASAASGQTALSFRATGGERYLFRVSSDSTDVGLIEIGVQLGEMPENDDFAGRIVLPGDELPQLSGNLGGGTLEVGEPVSGSWTSSAWWSWTPDESQGLLITANDIGVGVLRGEDLATLEWLAGPRSGAFSLEFVGGETYHLVALSGTNSSGVFEVDFERIERASNDDFAQRIDLGNEVPFEWSGHNYLTTVEEGEPLSSTSARNSIWYAWTAPVTGVFRIEGSGSGLFTHIGVYRGDAVDSLTEITNRSGVVLFEASENEVLMFSIRSSAVEGAMDFRIEVGALSVNDDFADRILIEDSSLVLEGDTAFASVEPGEPWAASNSLWWEWVAPRSMELGSAMTVRGGSLLLNVYETTSPDPELSDLRYSGGVPGDIRVTAGRRYFFQVTSRFQSTVGYDFRVELFEDVFGKPSPAEPLNNRFANRSDLGSEVGIKVAGNVYGATLEPEQSGRDYDGSIWWSWTAPTSGVFGLRPGQGNYPRPLTVYTGDELSSLTSIASSTFRDLWFEAEAGVSYAFEWRSSDIRYLDWRSFVSFEIIEAPASPANDDFAGAFSLDSGWGAFATGLNVLATSEVGEPSHGGSPATASVWYRWTAEETGRAEVSCFGVVLRTGVYQGSGFGTLIEIASGTEPIEFDVVAGQEYWIALDSEQPFSFLIRVNEVVVPPSSPDFFADAEELSGAVASVEVSTVGASLEEGEPYHTGSIFQGGSVWYRWTAPANGPVEVSGMDSSSYHLAVYLGDELASLAPIATGLDYTRLRFFAELGTEYRIAVSASSSVSAEFQLQLEQAATFPTNDRLAEGTILLGLSGTASGDLSLASRDAGEPWHASSPWEATVWYLWTAPVDGSCVFEVNGSGDEWLAAYQGDSYSALLFEASGKQQVGFSVQAGKVYSIAVGVPSYEDAGGFEISFDCREHASNDAFLSLSDLGTTSSAMLSGRLLGATRESMEPNHGGGTGSGSLWWRWTAPADGIWILDGTGSKSSAAMAIYQGEEINELLKRASVSRNGGDLLVWKAQAGESYLIVVDGLPENGGVGELEVILEPISAPNDAFAGRRLLSPGLPAEDRIVVNGASSEIGESRNMGTDTLWWEWQALEDGWVDIDLTECENAARPWVGVGSEVSLLGEVALQEVASDTWSFKAVAGSRYQLAIGSRYSNRVITGEVVLLMTEADRASNDMFADAFELPAEPGLIVSTSRGAGLEAGEPVIIQPTNRYRSLWWHWTAPRDGLVGFETGSGEWAAIFHDAEEIAELVELGEVVPNSGRFRVERGHRYRISAGDRIGRAFEIKVLFGPRGDLFDQPVELGSAFEVRRDDSLTGGSHEQGEPLHFNSPPDRSRWYRWIAPSAGRLEVGILAESAIWVSAYSGGQIDRLRCLTEGLNEISLDLVAGQELRLAVDTSSSVASPDYRLTLSFLPVGYEEWRDGYFAADEQDSGPDDDADHDGRSNFLELSMGTHPKIFDQGAAMSFDFVDGKVRLNLRRTAGQSDWSHHFEVSEDLRVWTPTTLLEHVDSITDHGDGTETFHSLLPNFGPATQSRLHFRPVATGSGG
ncbi:hypothetical protein [Haloferula sp.]|uniref:hypothetical protein n=1 Tax=Haloferula sp. TaxID=2497595 RepID=UPI003C774924